MENWNKPFCRRRYQRTAIYSGPIVSAINDAATIAATKLLQIMYTNWSELGLTVNRIVLRYLLHEMAMESIVWIL